MARIRPDQIESWTTENPVLEKGELGYELETNKAKLGDGVTTWNDLEYWSPSGPAEGTSVTQTITNGVTTTSPSEDAVFDALALKLGQTDADAAYVPFGATGRGAPAQRFGIGPRSSPTFPAVSVRPLTGTNLCALDVMPNDTDGRPVDTGNGAAWIDVCDVDCLTGNPALSVSRLSSSGLGAALARIEFGNYTFNGGTEKNIEITHNGRAAWRFYPQAGSVNFLGSKSGATGVAPLLAALSDTDTNVDLTIQGSGTGVINFGNATTTTSAPSAGGGGALPATPTGYMTIKVGGTARKVAYY